MQEVAQGVHWIRLPLPMALDHVNLYLLDDGPGWTVFDTGLDTRKNRAIWQALTDGPLAGKPLNRIIISHHHPDHVGLAGWLQVSHGAELMATRTAWLMARMLQLDEQDRPTPETVAFWKSGGMASDVLETRLNQRPFNFADLVAPMPIGFTRLLEGTEISSAGRRWRVHLGGGHAPDHATLWSLDGDLVLGGDQLLPGISPNIGLYATEPEADPLADWLESCERLAAHATPGQLVLPGHKLPYRGLPLRLEQLAENHVGALKRLRAFLHQPRTAAECFQPLFLRQIGTSEYGLALAEAMAHVVHLWHAGQATRTRRDDGAWLWQAVKGL
ncbi:MAG: MBL fold metallo-hydrolase [Pseudomonadota bacterium]